MVNKKAEGFLGIGFGMIFSIILIIFFIIIAFVAINGFLKVKNCSQIGLFTSDLQDEVDKTWHSSTNQVNFPSLLPTGVNYVCFADFSKALKGPNKVIGDDLSIYEGTTNNLFFYPRGSSCEMPTKQINNINVSDIVKTENPYCVPVIKGRINMKIEKAFSQNLVKISRG